MTLTLNPYDDCVGEDQDGVTWLRADTGSPWWPHPYKCECGSTLAPALERLGSLKCHDCRDGM